VIKLPVGNFAIGGGINGNGVQAGYGQQQQQLYNKNTNNNNNNKLNKHPTNNNPPTTLPTRKR